MHRRWVTGEQVKDGLGRCVLAALLPEHIHLQAPAQMLAGGDFQLGLEAIKLVSSSHPMDHLSHGRGGLQQEWESRTPLVRSRGSMCSPHSQMERPRCEAAHYQYPSKNP